MRPPRADLEPIWEEQRSKRGMMVSDVRKQEAHDLLIALKAGIELVESAYAHVSHGGPTREDAERWLGIAKAALASHAPSTKNAEGLIWATGRWNLEVRDRPLVNVNRRPLDDTWRQIIRYFGGDPDRLLGPNHDTLLANAPSEAAAQHHSCEWSDKIRAWKCRCGFISRIGAEVCTHQTEMEQKI